jgi:hypothetical protein
VLTAQLRYHYAPKPDERQNKEQLFTHAHIKILARYRFFRST